MYIYKVGRWWMRRRKKRAKMVRGLRWAGWTIKPPDSRLYSRKGKGEKRGMMKDGKGSKKGGRLYTNANTQMHRYIYIYMYVFIYT
jgi:hypothetical protein